LRARPCPFSAFSSTFNFIPYRISRITICRFCIICIMRSMEADCLEYQRVTHIRGPVGNRYCTLGFLGLHCTPFPYKSHMLKRLQQIPRIQWVACRTVPVTGAGAVQGRWYTIPVATRWHVLPIPVHVGERQAPETYRFRCNQGQKGSVMHRFRGYRGKLDAKKYQVPPRFPRLRGCTRPIVNSWVKFFPWGTGEGYPSGHVKQNRHAAVPRAGYTSGLFQPHLVCTLSPTCQAKSTRGRSTGGTYRPRRRAYSSGR
jgi:hypothetical protein